MIADTEEGPRADKPAKKLTKRTVDALTYTGTGNGACYAWDSEVKGFGVRVYPGGRKAFLVAYRAGPRKRFLTLGTFGKDLTADEARKLAIATLGDVVRGTDPAAVREQKAAESLPTGTLRELLDEYAGTLANPRTAADARQSFALNITHRLGSKPARDVTTKDVEGALGKVRARGALAVERNLFRFLHAAFEFARGNEGRRDRYRAQSNPVAEAERPAPGPAGNREMSAGEIRELWLRLDSAGMAPETATVFRLLLLTGQRVEEIMGARWSEIDFERRVLDIPPERLKTGAKTRRGHVVPLPDMALELLATLPRVGPCVFPKRADPENPMPFRSLSQAARRLCDDPDNPFPAFTPRDIRRSIKTRFSEIGVLKEIRDRVQNHALHDVASKHYDRFDYLADKKAALEGWQWEVHRILADKPATDDWRKWLRRFVKEPDNDLPGRQLARLLSIDPCVNVVPMARRA